MKKVIMLLTVALGLLYCADIKGQTTLGVKGGVNIADLSKNDYKPRIGVHGGVFVNRTLNKYWSVQPEVLYSGEGLKFTFSGLEHTWKLDYIQIPLMVQFYPIPQLYLDFGPQVGLLISATDKLAGGGHANLKANISTAQFGFGVGAGVKATDNFIFYGRYNFGITDVTSYDEIDHRSTVGQVGLAYRFD